MNGTAYSDYILIKANPVISDYDDEKVRHCCNSHQTSYQPPNNSNENTLAPNNVVESSSNGSNGHLVTTRQLLNSQRPRSLHKIEIVPAVVYGPLPFS